MKYLFITALFIISYTVTNAQVAVIINKSVPVNAISKSKLLDVYSLESKTWDNGQKIIVIDQKSDNSVKTSFYKYLGKSNADLKKVWMRMQLTGAGFAPQGMNSDADVLDKVANTPGAIGYVSQSAVNDRVKVITRID